MEGLFCESAFFLEATLHVFFFETHENALNIAAKYSLDIAPGFLETVIGDTILGEIVRTNFFTAVSGADLASSDVTLFFGASFFFGLEES